MNPQDQGQSNTSGDTQAEPVVSPRPVAPWAQPSTVVQPQPAIPAVDSAAAPTAPSPQPSQPQPAAQVPAPTQAVAEPPTPVESTQVQVPVQVIKPATTAQAPPASIPAEPQPPQPSAMPLPSQPTAVNSAPKSKLKITAVAGVIVIVLLVGAVSALTFLSKGQEAKVGSDYLKAVQAKDYAAVEKLIDPEVAKLGDKIGQAGGEEAKSGFYRQFLESTGDTKVANSANVENPHVTKKAGDGAKYAYVSYKVGSGSATVLETYDSNNKPKVLAIDSGLKTYPASQFKKDYQTYKSQMTSMGSLIDKIAPSSGSTGKQTIKAMFTADN